MEKRNKKERAWLAPGVEEEEVHYRDVGEHSQRQRHLGESRVDVTRLSWTECGRGGDRRGRRVRRARCISQEVEGTKKRQATKMSRLYRREPLGKRQPTLG